MSFKWGKGLKHLTVWTACLGMVSPANSWANDAQLPNQSHQATAAATPPEVYDVALQSGGVLEGQVVDAQGAPIPGAAVSVQQQQQEVANLTTDTNGSFKLSNARGGVYRLVSLQGEGTYRAWPQGTAPPSAQPKAVIRNVQFLGGAGGWLMPVLAGGIIVTAIAVPVALANRDRGGSSN